MNQRESLQSQPEPQFLPAPELAVRPEKQRADQQSLIARFLASSTDRLVDGKLQSPPSDLDRFLESTNFAESMALCFGEAALRRHAHLPISHFIEEMQREIARIDQVVSSQLNKVLHHPAFQKLEASWRGVYHLTNCKSRWSAAPIIISILTATWGELRSDLEDASDYDQSALFKKIYDEGIGTPGGYPFSTILVDYAIHPRPSREHPFDDIPILNRLAEVAQAAFCPIIANAHPSMFAEENFRDLRPHADYEKTQNGLNFLRWKSFRDDPAARFVSLAMPRLLMRRPYRASSARYFGFGFEETLASEEEYLWGGAAFGSGEVILRAFAEGHWLADIRGAQRGVESGGLVLGPTYEAFGTEPRDGAVKPLTDMVIGDEFERTLSKLGFLPLCACKDMPMAAFYSSATVQKARAFNAKDASANARLSTMLNYMLCASRFAHYVKIMTRNKVGSCSGPEQLEYILQNWLADYICDAEADARIRAEKPLRDAQIKISSIPGAAGQYSCVLQIAPHYEFEGVTAAVVLRDEKLVRNTKP